MKNLNTWMAALALVAGVTVWFDDFATDALFKLAMMAVFCFATYREGGFAGQDTNEEEML